MRFHFSLLGTFIVVLVAGTGIGVLIAVVPPLVTAGSWTTLAVIAVALVGIIAVYALRRTLPLKFILPGVFLLTGLLVVPILLTAQLSTTNYGDGTRTAQQDVVERIIRDTAERAADDPTSPAVVGTTGSVVTGPFTVLVLSDDGTVLAGSEDSSLAPVPEARVQVDDGRIAAVRGYTLLSLAQQNAVSGPGGPLKDLTVDAGGGELVVLQGTAAVTVRPTIAWDPDHERLTDLRTGTVYTAQRTEQGDRSYFVSDSGDRLSSQSWLEDVGAFNYKRLFTDSQITTDFVRILLWTIVFAAVTVATQFALGLFLAVTLDDRRVRLQRFWRAFLLIPYAIPSFITILVWSSFWNRDFGLVNDLLGLHVDWLGDPNAARVAVLMTNLWLGFPYMFLVCTGALQGIPSELKESAALDGARGWTRFANITLPLVLSSVAPLLVASFAVNFNNFNIIQLLTGGGPFTADNPTAGATDILISYTYRLAFGNSGSQIGFASAVSVVLFVLTAVLAMVQFRASRRFEEVL